MSCGTHSGRHRLEVGHLAMGVAFLGLAGVWALVAGDVVGPEGVRWLLPLPWLAAGLAGSIGLVVRGRRSSPHTASAP